MIARQSVPSQLGHVRWSAAILVACLVAAGCAAGGASAIPSAVGSAGPTSSPAVSATDLERPSTSTGASPSSAIARNPSAYVAGASYAPAWDPTQFSTTVTNPLMPLVPGTVTTFDGEGEHVVVTVTDRTRTIAGVKTVVVHDQGFDPAGKALVEDTEDYYAQDAAGNVWYFGEVTGECDHGKVTSREGSWETGVDGAQPGVVMLADPQVGDAYRQEFLTGHAEDLATVLKLDGTVSGPTDDYTGVLVTEEVTPLEPDLLEHKSYARGVGVIQEEALKPEPGLVTLTKVETGATVPPATGSFEPCAG